MEKHTKRVRSSNWNHAHTLALAELKKEASLNKEDGRLVWERIAQTLSSRFPGQIRTGVQCQRRWDILVKVYNHIEDYCVVTGAQDHRELDKGELASMKLATAYQQDWFDIVEQVCSQRKRKERCDRAPMLPKRSKGSSDCVELLEHPPNRDTLRSASTSKSVTQHYQSTPESTTSAQVSSCPSLEEDKLGLEEEVPRLENGNYGLLLEAMQLQQHAQVSHEVSQEPQTLESVKHGGQLKEPLPDDFWDAVDAMPLETRTEIEQSETESEIPGLFNWDLELEGLEEILPDHVWNDSFAEVMSARESNLTDEFKFCSELETHSESVEPHSLPNAPPIRDSPTLLMSRRRDMASTGTPMAGSGHSTLCRARPMTGRGPPTDERGPAGGGRVPPGGGRGPSVVPPKDECVFGRRLRISPYECVFSQQDLTIPRQSRRWSLKVIVLRVLQCCHACGRKERVEDLEMESKQAARLKEKARKEALMSRKENVPAMPNAASSTSATSATRGDKPSKKDTERTCKQAALDKKEEGTRPRKAARQQLRDKSSSKCVPMGNLCAKLSRKLFPVFHGQS